MSVNKAVHKLNVDLQHLRHAQAAEKKVAASETKVKAHEKTTLASLGAQQQKLVDQFVSSGSTMSPADMAKLLGQAVQIGVKEQQAKDGLASTLAKDKKALAADKKALTKARHQALHDLKPAEYHLGLKETNKDRKELGLKSVSHVIRPAVSSGAQKILDVARKWIGYHEGAGNSNRFSHDMGRPSEAWCADFVSYCVKHAGLHTVNTASAQQVANELAAKGRWKGRHNPQPGDAVTFNWSGSHGWADHVGLVEKVFKRNGQTYIQTIEGNSGDAVTRHVYPANSQYINGFGRLA